MIAASGPTTQAQLDEAVARMHSDLDAPTCHCVTPFFIAYGQRSG